MTHFHFSVVSPWNIKELTHEDATWARPSIPSLIGSYGSLSGRCVQSEVISWRSLLVVFVCWVHLGEEGHVEPQKEAHSPSPLAVSSYTLQPPPQEVPLSHHPGIKERQAASTSWAMLHEHIPSASIWHAGSEAAALECCLSFNILSVRVVSVCPRVFHP